MSKTPPESGGRPQQFPPTSGTLTGWVGLVAAAVAVVVVLATERTLVGLRFGLAIALFGVLVWCFMLRPRLVVGEAVLELRNAFSSWHVPLVRIRSVTVRAITRVHTDARHYDGVAVGRPVRSMMRAGLDPQRHAERRPTSADTTADLVADLISQAADHARIDALVADREDPWRRWAVVELVAVAVLAAAFAVSLLV